MVPATSEFGVREPGGRPRNAPAQPHWGNQGSGSPASARRRPPRGAGGPEPGFQRGCRRGWGRGREGRTRGGPRTHRPHRTPLPPGSRCQPRSHRRKAWTREWSPRCQAGRRWPDSSSSTLWGREGRGKRVSLLPRSPLAARSEQSACPRTRVTVEPWHSEGFGQGRQPFRSHSGTRSQGTPRRPYTANRWFPVFPHEIVLRIWPH